MTTSGRTFRLFVSSTFSDLKVERNALQERVFPALREMCEERGARFQVIDLRWGVSSEASLDQQAMGICLGEIERCRMVTPRPNFLVLLGDRYGWRPLPRAVNALEFHLLLERMAGPERELACWREGAPPGAQGWYRCDHNALPDGEYILQPRQKGSRYEEFETWEREVERPLRQALERAARRAGLHGERLPKYSLSATGQEIAAGAPQVADAREHVFCFFRSIAGLPDRGSPVLRDFVDLDPESVAVDAEALDAQARLKAALAAHLPGNVHTYEARWTGAGITTDHIERLCEEVQACLARVIQAEIEHPHQVTAAGEETIRPDPALDEEGHAHQRFAGERRQHFVGREALLARIAAHLSGGSRRTLGVTGAGGCGKSALMAQAVQQAQEAHPGAAVVYRFIGATPGSSDGRGLLDSLTHEISRRYSKSEADIPLDYRDLVPELGKRMKHATAARPLLLFLDSLDQLSAAQGARSLAWLPGELPEHVCVIASTRPGDTLDALRARQGTVEEMEVLSPQEGEGLMGQWLTGAGRTLRPEQRRALLGRFEQSERNPLYLRLAIEEARRWSSWQVSEDLATGVAGIIEHNMMPRLALEAAHGSVLVSRAMGYLAASRYGLAEDELVDLLSRDLDVYGWFMEGSYHMPPDLVRQAAAYRRGAPEQPTAEEEAKTIEWLREIRTRPQERNTFLAEALPQPDGPRLPVVLWSRLFFDLSPYLAQRMVEGVPALAFYHRELRDAAAAAYLADGQDALHHERLADYFRAKADPDGDGSWTGHHAHSLSELPFHLAHAGRHDELYGALTDFSFLERKAAGVGVQQQRDERGRVTQSYGGVQALQEDLRLALEVLPGGEEAGTGSRAPLIVTARETEAGVSVFCPVCGKSSPVRKETLDKVIACPQPGCGTRLKLNPFVVRCR
ncbi:MAG TPA: DUF4062 domain-containing protein [Anaerolineae bacterium]|nr:DUF4062 domain-containing protein [Anaerolineae bacterium]